MAKLSHGPASHAVKASQGPPSSSLHFYSTNYSRHHGRHSEVQGELGTVARRTRGTGYIANYRPTLYYTSQLDHHDNPDMISLLADNYVSLTSRHYAGFGGVSGKEPLPQRTHSCLSGYSCNLPRTTPTAKQGQGKLSTETHTKFIPKPFRNEALRGSQYTHREETGFTHAQNIEPVTFRPREAFANDLSPQATWRPTGRSVMKKDFSLPSQHPGDEGMPLSLGRANCSSGYVKGSNFPSTVQPKSTEMVGYTVASQLQPSPLAILSRQDPTHFSTIIHPDPFSSYTHYCLETGCKSDMKGRGGVGSKELTGFSENNQPLLEPQDRDSRRFSTHYHSRFPRPPLHSRPGGVSGGVQAAAPNGFTKGTAVHVHHFQKGQVNTAALLRSMHPSQARVVLCRDPCYDDHTHDSKHHTPTTKTQP